MQGSLLITLCERGLRIRDEGIVSVAASTGRAGRYRPCVDGVLRTHAWEARDCTGAEGQCEQKAGDATHQRVLLRKQCAPSRGAKNQQIQRGRHYRACDLPMLSAVACKIRGGSIACALDPPQAMVNSWCVRT